MAKIQFRKKDENPVDAGRIDFLEFYEEDRIKSAKAEILQKFSESRDYRNPYKAQWFEYYQLYRCYSPYYEDRPDYQSSIFIPKVHEAIQTVRPRIMSALYGSRPLWEAIPMRPEYAKASTQLENLLETRVDQTNLYMSHHELFTEALLYGTAIAKIHYVVTNNYEGSMTTPIDLYDFYPDPAGKDIPSMRFCFHREVHDIDALKVGEVQGIYKNLENVKSGTGQKWFSKFDRMRSIGTGIDIGSESSKNLHEVLEYWGKWTDPDTQEVFDIVFVIVDRDIVIRFEESPYMYPLDGFESEKYYYAEKPFVAYRTDVVPHEFYGVGIIEPIRSLQYELNDRRNMLSDALQLSITPVYEAMVGAIKNLSSVTFAPGSIIEKQMPEGLKPLSKDMSYTQGYQDMAELNRNIQDATGIYDLIRGSVSQRKQTATETTILQQEGNVRIKSILESNERTALAQHARMIYLQEKQFTDSEILVKMYANGKPTGFEKINPSELKWGGDFRLQVASLYGMKGIIANQRMQFLDLLAKMPPEYVASNINMDKLVKLIADSLDIKDAGLFIEQKPEPVQKAPELPQNMLGPSLGSAPDIAPQMPPMPEQMVQGPEAPMPPEVLAQILSQGS